METSAVNSKPSSGSLKSALADHRERLPPVVLLKIQRTFQTPALRPICAPEGEQRRNRPESPGHQLQHEFNEKLKALILFVTQCVEPPHSSCCSQSRMNTGISAIIQTPTKDFDEGVGPEELPRARRG